MAKWKKKKNQLKLEDLVLNVFKGQSNYHFAVVVKDSEECQVAEAQRDQEQ